MKARFKESIIPGLMALLALAVWPLDRVRSQDAQNLAEVAGEIDSDLDVALAQYGKVQSTIGKEKVPLLREYDELDDQVREVSKSLAQLRRESVQRSRDQVELNNNVKSLETNIDFMIGLLKEFNRGFGSRIHVSENQVYRPDLTALNNKLLGPEPPLKDELLVNSDILDISLTRLELAVGGQVFEGSALSPSGEKLKGKFAIIGPSGFFASADKSLAGVTNFTGKDENVSIVELGGGTGEGIRNLVENGEGTVAFDATLGKALRIETSQDTMMEHIAKGGTVGYAILFLGAFAALAGLFKYVEISRFHVPNPNKVNSIIDSLVDGDEKAAQIAAYSIRGKAGEMIQLGVEKFHARRRILEELLYERLLSIRPKLERFLPFLAVTAAAAPLMGLLGTVMGMIKTFKLITEFGTGDAKSLSSGISEALVTTELGLVVAIPTLILHGILSRMARGKVGRMEATAMAFLNGVSEVEMRDDEPGDDVSKAA